jgi:hypothetical protein
MRQAIVTKYIGPTNCRDSRVKAVGGGRSLTLPWDSRLDAEGNAEWAARRLATSLGWLKLNDMQGGSLPQTVGYAYCWVFTPKKGTMGYD